MNMGCPFPLANITVVHMEDVDLLKSFFPDEVNFEASVEILVPRVLVIVPILEFEVLVDRDNASLHSLHCILTRFLRIWE